MVVGRGAAEVVVEAQAFFDGVDVAVEELDLVDRAVGATLAAGPVIGDHHDDGVVQLARLLQVVQDAADLVVGVAEESGEDLCHAGEETLLFVIE